MNDGRNRLTNHITSTMMRATTPVSPSVFVTENRQLAARLREATYGRVIENRHIQGIP